MKHLKLVLSLATVLGNSSAFAYGAHDFTLACRSKSAKVEIEFTSAEADGVFLTSVKFNGQTIDSEKVLAVRNPQSDMDAAPTRLGFVSGGHLVGLVLKNKDIVQAALVNGPTEGKGIAFITSDAKAELADCE